MLRINNSKVIKAKEFNRKKEIRPVEKVMASRVSKNLSISINNGVISIVPSKI